jgi:adenosylcobinamide-GDP ribazoletransferase
MKRILYAIRFLTTLPLGYKKDENLTDVATSVIFFPLVGGLIGLCLSFLFKFSLIIFSPSLSALFVVVFWIIITGGLHLDGVADSFDGIFGGRTPENRLEIMRDSRIGSFGVLSLIVFILLKLFLIIEISSHTSAIRYLLVAPIIGRWISLFLIFTFKSAKKDGLGSFFKSHLKLIHYIIPAIYTLLAIYLILGLPGVVILLLTVLVSGLLALFVISKIRGLTGDIYGALCEFSEIFTLFLGLIWLNLP